MDRHGPKNDHCPSLFSAPAIPVAPGRDFQASWTRLRSLCRPGDGSLGKSQRPNMVLSLDMSLWSFMEHTQPLPMRQEEVP